MEISDYQTRGETSALGGQKVRLPSAERPVFWLSNSLFPVLPLRCPLSSHGSLLFLFAHSKLFFSVFASDFYLLLFLEDHDIDIAIRKYTKVGLLLSIITRITLLLGNTIISSYHERIFHKIIVRYWLRIFKM